MRPMDHYIDAAKQHIDDMQRLGIPCNYTETELALMQMKKDYESALTDCWNTSYKNAEKRLQEKQTVSYYNWRRERIVETSKKPIQYHEK